MSKVRATCVDPRGPWVMTVASPPPADVPGGPLGVGVGVGRTPEFPGLAEGGLASSTVTPGMSISVQPGSMWFGAYASDSGSRVG